MMTTFEDLEVWRRGCQLAVDVCVATGDSREYALRNSREMISETRQLSAMLQGLVKAIQSRQPKKDPK